MKPVQGYNAEVLLFQMVRNHILPTGSKLNKTEAEIDAMTLETIGEMYGMLDFDRAAKRYNGALIGKRSSES